MILSFHNKEFVVSVHFQWSMKVFWCEPFASHSIEQKAIHVLFRKHDDNDEGEKDVKNRLSLQSSSWKIMGQKERETGLNFFHLQLKGESIQGVSFFVWLSSPNNFSTDSLPMKPQRLLVGQESLSLYYCDTKWGVTMKAIESFGKNAKQRYLFSSTCKWSTQEHSRRERERDSWTNFNVYVTAFGPWIDVERNECFSHLKVWKLLHSSKH